MAAQIIASFILSVILTILLTPWVIRFSHMIGAIDAPGERKVHQTIIPRLGGLAIFTSVAITSLFVYLFFPSLFDGLREYSMQAYIVMACLASIFMLGFWDDLKPLKPGLKFGVQFLVAGLIYFAGFKISNVTNPLGMGVLNVEMIDFPLTLLWIVGITNAFNLIDGLDGLASGIATIACISIFTVSLLAGEIWTAVFAIILAGSLIGFLKYNFNPARIFLGDSGSLLIGFSLALMSIHSTTKITTGFALLFPLLLLVLPITDTLISMIRRFLSTYLLEKSNGRQSLRHKLHKMFTPDKSHIHHQLLSLGLTHRNTVLLLYGVSAFFALGAFAITQANTPEMSILIALLAGVTLFLGIKNLKYREMAILNNGMMVPVYERFIVNKTTFLSLADMIFIATSFWLSYALMYSIHPATVATMHFNHFLIAILCVQLIAFWLTGLYRESMKQMGIGNALGITASVFYATLATGGLLYLAGSFTSMPAFQFLVFNFYFLLTFTLSFRFTYQALRYWFNRDKISGKNVLIYGANENGSLLVRKLNSSIHSKYKIMGFLEDDPEMEGRQIDGYPVWGGHWKLPKALAKHRVDYIFICEQSIKPENLNRLKEMAGEQNIDIKILQIRLKDMAANPDTPPEDKIRESKPEYSYM